MIVPIHFYPRTVAQGKKIRWKDGVYGIWAMLKYRLKIFDERLVVRLI